MWSPLRPDGSYVLNLALPEDRQIARVLTHVEASESYSQLLDLRLLDVPSIDNWAAPATEKVVADNPWRRELPAKASGASRSGPSPTTRGTAICHCGPRSPA